METFWYRDQETGERLYGAAKSDPVYNADFTQMKVDLRDNIFWSDGVQFNADDVVYTIETIKANNQLAWNADLNLWVDSIEKTGRFQRAVQPQEAESPLPLPVRSPLERRLYDAEAHLREGERPGDLHSLKSRWCWARTCRPKFDPNGFWELYQIRDDWQKTPAGITVGQPGPKYVLTIFYGDSTKKAIAMSRHELDVFFDADFEAFKSVIEFHAHLPLVVQRLPLGLPERSRLPATCLSTSTIRTLRIKDVRWALTLALDVVDMQTNYIGGVAKVTVIPVAPTGALMKLYHDQLEEWLKNLEIEIEPGTKYKPYDPTIPDQIAAWATKQGYTVPGKPRDVFGTGWWKYAPDVAEKLLIKNGFKKDAKRQMAHAGWQALDD